MPRGPVLFCGPAEKLTKGPVAVIPVCVVTGLASVEQYISVHSVVLSRCFAGLPARRMALTGAVAVTGSRNSWSSARAPIPQAIRRAERAGHGLSVCESGGPRAPLSMPVSAHADG